jgi:hypothetical protein
MSSASREWYSPEAHEQYRRHGKACAGGWDSLAWLLLSSCQLQHTIVNFFANIPAMCSSYSERQYRFDMRYVLRATPALL